MIWLFAFLFSGFMCALAETIYQYTKLTPGHINTIFVISGVFLEAFNIYDFFIEKCGGGAYILITSFGHTLAHSVREGVMEKGIIGIFESIFVPVSVSLSVIILFSFICHMFFKPKSQ